VLQSNLTVPVPSLVMEIEADPLAVIARFSPLVKSKHADYPWLNDYPLIDAVPDVNVAHIFSVAGSLT